MTEGEDTAVKDGHQKISPCCIITAKSRDQRQGDDVDDIDGDPCRAFDEFFATCIGKGIPVIWSDVI